VRLSKLAAIHHFWQELLGHGGKKFPKQVDHARKWNRQARIGFQAGVFQRIDGREQVDGKTVLEHVAASSNCGGSFNVVRVLMDATKRLAFQE
jgi:hypothetical protein